MSILKNISNDTVIQMPKKDHKVDNAEVIAMANVMRKLEETTANLPSKKVNEVVDQLKSFMETLVLSDCELFARDVRRMMDNLIEVRIANKDQSKNISELAEFEEIMKNRPTGPGYPLMIDSDSLKDKIFMKNILQKLEVISNTEVVEVKEPDDITFFKNLLRKLKDSSNKVEESSTKKLEERLNDLEKKINLLVDLIKPENISKITNEDSNEKKGE